jgi:hypothetical protein
VKWYHKAVYRLANSVLPESVKQAMMGVGRVTVPKNANPWNVFNWLPKKYQTAHNIDLTKLQNYTAEELLELLISVHPDVSHAVHTYLRIGDTPLSFTAKTMAGKKDNNGQKTVDDIYQMLNQELSSPGYQHGRSLDKLDGIQRLMVMVRGACAGEVILNDACTEVVDIVPVDPAIIWFRRLPDTNRLVPWQYVKNPRMKPGEEWFGQYKKIDTPTFIYEELDPMVDDPYGRTPILPVLQVVFFHIQVLQDLKAVVHNQGYPRMAVSILEEVMLKNMPAQYKNDPNAQRKWLNDRLGDIQTQFSSLNPDDALIGWDSVKYEYLKGSGTGPMIDVKKLIDVIDTQLATSLKTLLTLLSRHQGSTETYSSVDTQLYIKTVESARSITKRFWERALSMAARVNGVQTIVAAEYEPIDLRTENELETDRQLRIDNLIIAEESKYITPEEAATESRKALGLDPKIPTELKAKLKEKMNPPEPPPMPPPNPPQPEGPNVANKRVVLSNDGTEDSDDEDHEQTFIWLYLALMSHVKQNLKHATSLDSIVPAMSLTEGMKNRLQNGLWQLKRNKYVDSYNVRANDAGTGRIRNPDADTSVDLHHDARKVIDGTTSTYHDLLDSAFENALESTKDLPEEERLSDVKKIMSDWVEENADYKSKQIAGHEGLKAIELGMFAHDELHAPHTMYVVVPNSSHHDACISLISGGPYTLPEARSLRLPLHPNCPHHCVPV